MNENIIISLPYETMIVIYQYNDNDYHYHYHLFSEISTRRGVGGGIRTPCPLEEGRFAEALENDNSDTQNG